MMHVPSRVLEAVDGTFLMLLFFSLGVTGRYMVSVTRRDVRAGRWNPLRWEVEAKAAWSLGVIFFGLILRVGAHWSRRHADNHGLHGPVIDAIVDAGPAIVFVSTLLTAWGSICWIRSVIPLRCGILSWATAAVLAIAFGIYMAL